MSAFTRRGSSLYCEDVELAQLAERFGTPLYVYAAGAIRQTFNAYAGALAGCPHLICYAVKANSNLAVLNLLARLGAGFDIVSGGELGRVIAAGGDPATVVFSGVCKQPDEMRAALAAGIRCFNVESDAELDVLNAVALSMGTTAPVSLRVNPNVDARTHPYIATGLRENKFGIAIEAAVASYRRAQELPGIAPIGLDCHIGSQLLDTAPFFDTLDRLLALIDELEHLGVALQHLDLGGGLGVSYSGEAAPDIAGFVTEIRARLGSRSLELLFEPGRSIVAMSGVLLTRVAYLKPTAHRNFALVDAGMNDLLRPALYDAVHDIVPVSERPGATQTWNVVGPVCETGDFLGKDRALCLAPGDLLAVTGAGAYGFVMASNYNTRPRPAEVMVAGDQAQLIRAREETAALWSGEALLPEALL